jgi:anti-anti-sigma factor
MLLQIVERKIEPDIIVLELAGRLALGRESQKIETMVDAILQQGASKAVLDMTAVDYIDSAGLGLLALAAGKLNDAGGKLVVVAPEGRVLRMLQMTQLTAIVTVVSSVGEAQSAMGGS